MTVDSFVIAMVGMLSPSGSAVGIIRAQE
jgi:hypothetical protein